MFILGSHIVETYAKTLYTTFVKERIFVPLNMSSSTYFTTEVSEDDHISEAFTQGRRRIPYWFGDLDAATLIAGAGGIISNTVDMVCFARLIYRYILIRVLDQMARHAAQRRHKSLYE